MDFVMYSDMNEEDDFSRDEYFHKKVQEYKTELAKKHEEYLKCTKKGQAHPLKKCDSMKIFVQVPENYAGAFEHFKNLTQNYKSEQYLLEQNTYDDYPCKESLNKLLYQGEENIGWKSNSSHVKTGRKRYINNELSKKDKRPSLSMNYIFNSWEKYDCEMEQLWLEKQKSTNDSFKRILTGYKGHDDDTNASLISEQVGRKMQSLQKGLKKNKKNHIKGDATCESNEMHFLEHRKSVFQTCDTNFTWAKEYEEDFQIYKRPPYHPNLIPPPEYDDKAKKKRKSKSIKTSTSESVLFEANWKKDGCPKTVEEKRRDVLDALSKIFGKGTEGKKLKTKQNIADPQLEREHAGMFSNISPRKLSTKGMDYEEYNETFAFTESNDKDYNFEEKMFRGPEQSEKRYHRVPKSKELINRLFNEICNIEAEVQAQKQRRLNQLAEKEYLMILEKAALLLQIAIEEDKLLMAYIANIAKESGDESDPITKTIDNDMSNEEISPRFENNHLKCKSSRVGGGEDIPYYGHTEDDTNNYNNFYNDNIAKSYEVRESSFNGETLKTVEEAHQSDSEWYRSKSLRVPLQYDIVKYYRYATIEKLWETADEELVQQFCSVFYRQCVINNNK